MKCHYCKAGCVKKGKRKCGTQKYQCVECKKYQQEDYKNKAWLPETNKKISRCPAVNILQAISTALMDKRRLMSYLVEMR
jgi:hypothetical protein